MAAEKQRRKVCLFIPHLGLGGAELQLALLARELAPAGFDPVVATMEFHHGLAERLAEEGIRVVALPRRGRVGLDTIAGLARLVRRERIDLVHSWLYASNWRAALARVLNPRTPVVLSIRSMQADVSSSQQRLFRLIAPLVHSILVNSEAVKVRAVERSGLPPYRFHVVRNGIDFERVEREAVLPMPELDCLVGSPVVGMLGGLFPRKRPLTLARIAPAIVEGAPDVRFLVVGGGPAYSDLVAECSRLGVLNRFVFVGYRDSAYPFLRRMNVLVHPSENEGCSNAILEAQAVGVPVVAYAVGGNPEIVVDGLTGYLVQDADETTIASRVLSLVANPEQASRMGMAATHETRRRFDLSETVRRTVSVYEAALEGRDLGE